MASSPAAAACAGCGAPVAALPLGPAPPLCEICGRHASHLAANGRPDETASSDGEPASSDGEPEDAA